MASLLHWMTGNSPWGKTFRVNVADWNIELILQFWYCATLYLHNNTKHKFLLGERPAITLVSRFSSPSTWKWISANYFVCYCWWWEHMVWLLPEFDCSIICTTQTQFSNGGGSQMRWGRSGQRWADTYKLRTLSKCTMYWSLNNDFLCSATAWWWLLSMCFCIVVFSSN